MDFDERRPRMGRGPIPVKEGDTYDVTIEGIGEKGDGIAKINGYVIIVPRVKKGDRVKIRVNAVRGKVSFGEVVGEASESGDAGEGNEKAEEPSDDPDMAGDNAEESADAEEDVEEPEGEEPMEDEASDEEK